MFFFVYEFVINYICFSIIFALAICRNRSRYKKENAVTILQIERWFEILKTRKDWGEDSNLDPQMIGELFELIHKHSVLTQTHILNK